MISLTLLFTILQNHHLHGIWQCYSISLELEYVIDRPGYYMHQHVCVIARDYNHANSGINLV